MEQQQQQQQQLELEVDLEQLAHAHQNLLAEHGQDRERIVELEAALAQAQQARDQLEATVEDVQKTHADTELAQQALVREKAGLIQALKSKNAQLQQLEGIDRPTYMQPLISY